MQYIDPFEFAGIDPSETLRPETIKRARSRVLSEFELEGKTVIPYRNLEVDRQWAMNVLEGLNDLEIAGYYRRIKEDPSLKRFLESGDPEDVIRLHNVGADQGKSFRKWLSPFFAHSFGKSMAQSVRNGRFKDVWLLTQSMDLLEVSDLPEALKPLTELVAGLKDRAYTHEMTKRDEYALESSDLSLAVAELPEILGDVHDELGLALLYYGEILKEKKQTGKARQVLEGGEQLRLTPNTRKRIEKLNAELGPAGSEWERTKRTAYARYEEERKKRRIPALAFIAVIVSIGLMIYIFSSRGGVEKKRDVSKMDFREKLSLRMDNVMFFNKLGMASLTDIDFLPEPTDTIRPETGFIPYKTKLPGISCDGPACVKVEAINRSGRDAVVFLQQDFGVEEISRHAYIRQGDSFTLEPLDVGNYKLTWYSGRAWQPGSFTPDDFSFGSFQRDVTEPYDTDTTEFRNWMNVRLSGDQEKVLISFDGDSLRRGNP